MLATSKVKLPKLVFLRGWLGERSEGHRAWEGRASGAVLLAACLAAHAGTEAGVQGVQGGQEPVSGEEGASSRLEGQSAHEQVWASIWGSRLGHVDT